RLFELLLLTVGHHAEGHLKHFFGRDAGDVGERGKQSVYAQIGMVADLEVQVGRLVFDGSAQQIVNASGHRCMNPANVQLEQLMERR
ncbi:MAG TPA: hypothetical protein VNB49_06090, partial [Candidatus Dormibacteraeota bacterium]|nr:hypothetical protein [Candidatus Dormibacteraeota bacterium]